MSLESTLQELIEVMKEDIAVRRDFLNAFRTGTQPAERAAVPTTDAAPVEASPAPVAEPAKATPETAPAEHADEPMSQSEYMSCVSMIGNRWREVFGDNQKEALNEILSAFGLKSFAVAPAEKRREVIDTLERAMAEARHV